MGTLTFTTSPLVIVDNGAKDGNTASVKVLCAGDDGNPVTFAEAIGRDAHEARIRAEFMCVALSKMQPAETYYEVTFPTGDMK